VTLGSLISRLDSLLLVLKTCRARECTNPWEVLHPLGDVQSLYDALEPRFDDFYENQQDRVDFLKCEDGYILSSEGPIAAKPFPIGEEALRGGSLWHELV
jgi:hypothetical protein